MFFDNGAYYEGNFLDGKASDEHALFIFSNGTFYKGALVQGKAEGRGFYQCDKYCYLGQWEDDKPHGKGRQESDTCVYIGNFYKGQKQGEGTIIWTDGSNYRGTFKNNQLSGTGTFTTSQYVYKGEFSSNKKNGKGTIKYRWALDQYEGIFKDDKKTGVFIYKDSNGVTYQSTFENDHQMTPFLRIQPNNYITSIN